MPENIEGRVNEQPDPRKRQDTVGELAVAAHVDAKAILEEADGAEATDNEGQPLTPDYRREREANFRYIQSSDLEDGYRKGETLAQRERREGRTAEQMRHTREAWGNFEGVDLTGGSHKEPSGPTTLEGAYRWEPEEESADEQTGDQRHYAASSRVCAGEKIKRSRQDSVSYGVTRHRTRDDAYDLLMEEVQSSIDEFAEKVAERPLAPSVERLRNLLAKRALSGTSPGEAAMQLIDRLPRLRGGRPIATIPSWMTQRQYDVSLRVVGVVKRLFEPAGRGQQQVGVIDDGTETAKVTIWKRSGQNTVLSEGDVVRLERVKVGSYNGQKTLAVIGESRVEILERGDGPAPLGGADMSDCPDRGQDPKPVVVPEGLPDAKEQRPANADVRSPSLVEEHGFYACSKWKYPVEVCPDWFIEEHTDTDTAQPESQQAEQSVAE